jgi:hypothetical protein
MGKAKVSRAISIDVRDFIFWSLFFIAALSWYGYLVTNFSFDFNTHEIFGEIYVRTLDQLKHWKWNIEPEVLQYEGYLRDGKYYPYFGPFPALLRGALELIFGRRAHDWSRISCLMGAMMTLMACQITIWLRGARRRIKPGTRRRLCVATGLVLLCSSSIAFTLNVAYIYNEAIIWSLAWTMAYTAIYLTRPQQKTKGVIAAVNSGVDIKRYLVMAFCTLCALLSRFSIGGAALAHFTVVTAAAIYLSKKPRISWATAARGAAYLFTWFAPLLVNFERWGNPFIFLPLTWNTVMHGTPVETVVKTYSLMNLKRLPLCFEYYFWPHSSNFSAHLPWIDFGKDFIFGSLAFLFVYVEPTQIPVCLSSAALFVGFVAALVALAQKKMASDEVILLAAMSLPALMILVFVAVAQRYGADIFPVLFTGTVLALDSIQLQKKKVAMALAALVAVSCILGMNTIIRDKIYTSTLTPAEVQNLKSFLHRLEGSSGNP